MVIKFVRQILLILMLAATAQVATAAQTDWRYLKTFLDQAKGLNKTVLSKALTAFENAQDAGITDNSLLTIIDYSRPSTEQRLWTFDLSEKKPKLLFQELVSHGRKSGELYARSFSNDPGSYQSSLGLFLTEESYVGRNGYSMRLHGLEEGINDLARERAIVFHGADYVHENIIKKQGRLGRSLGCPAVRKDVNRQLIDTIKGGSLVFIYYPDKVWLAESEFLNPQEKEIRVSSLMLEM